MTLKWRTLIVSLVAVAASAGFTSSALATAAPPAGNYYGNQCSSARGYVQGTGAEACYWVNSYSLHSWFNFSFGAFDLLKDGHSARNFTYVQQYYSGAWHNTNTFQVTESSGYPYTRVSGRYTVYRHTGASYIRLLVYACTYDVPTATYYGCSSAYKGTTAW